MKRFWHGSLFLALLFLFLPVRTLAQCGVERWSVKTGTDPDAGLVNLNSPTATTIASLSSIATPSPLPDDQREVFLMRELANLPFKEIAEIRRELSKARASSISSGLIFPAYSSAW